MSRDDREISEKKGKCRNIPRQQHIQYCLSWKSAKTATSQPHLGMLPPSKQVPLCPQVDPTLRRSLNATNSNRRFEACDDVTRSRRLLPGSPLRRGQRSTGILYDKSKISSTSPTATAPMPIASNPHLPPPQFADNRSPSALDGGGGFGIGIGNYDRCGRD